jgi:hypothetical protein
MRPDDVLQQLRQLPFRPLRLLLTTGAVHEIRHAELAMVGRSTLTLEFPGAEFPVPVATRVLVIALLHIVQIELIEPVLPASTN